FSYSGYHHLSVKGGELKYPPDGSGLRLQPTKPSSLTQSSGSLAGFFGATLSDCGSWQTPMKFFGNSVTQRWIRSLQICVHSMLTDSSPTWWPMPEARGEKIVTSV